MSPQNSLGAARVSRKLSHETPPVQFNAIQPERPRARDRKWERERGVRESVRV